ncbi:MAG: BON domain-containing protein [Elusimicrobia bacterium]|nr:BON domain-containing protein [Elusimicrobiota bacterium]
MLALIMGLASLNLSGCFWVLLGGAAEGGYVAGQDQSASETLSDQWITAKIKSKLIADKTVQARSINVDTVRGVVTLRGTLSSRKERKRAVAIARETQGVKKVVEELTVGR